MTTAVMEHSENDPSVPFKVVLTLNCPDSQRYLQPENKVLEVLAGCTVQRVSGRIETPLVYPKLEQNDVMLLHFLRQNPTLSLGDITRLIRGSWPLDLAQDTILAQICKKFRDLPAKQMPLIVDWVKVVIINNELLQEKTRLRTVVQIFHNATFFAVQGTGHEVPRQIWREPMCDRCHQPMRASGSVFLCEGCGDSK